MVTVQYNPFTPESQADPYPLYRQLRDHDPVHHAGLMDAWVLTRYEDVVAVLRDGRFSANRRRARNQLAAQAAEMIEQEESPLARANTMLSSDPPEHTRLRGLVSKAFTPRAVEALRPRIQQIVDGLLDEIEGGHEIDVIEHLAYPLPVIVIAELLGVPPEDRAQFKSWSSDVVATLGGPFVGPEALGRARTSSLELAGYFSEVIAERRRAPKDDVLSALIAAEEAGEVLSEEELLATCILLLVAGNETTTNLIGNGMLALLRHPDQLEKLRDDPSLTETAIEEFLRYDGPVQATARVALEEMEIDGRPVREGDLVVLQIGAANRDPAQFPDPDRLDITRQPNRHIAFGQGIHSCIGAPLARLEGQIAFPAFLSRFPNPRLAIDTPQWRPSFILRGLRRLPVEV